MRRHIFVMVLALLPASAFAQTVMSPTQLLFSPSPDHNATKIDGTAVLTRYQADAMAMNAQGALVWSFDVGKPPVAADGNCPITGQPCCKVILAQPLPITVETLYSMTLTSIGPDGNSAPSTASNPFGVAGTRVPGAASNVKVK